MDMKISDRVTKWDDYVEINTINKEEWNALPVDPEVNKIVFRFIDKGVDTFEGWEVKYPNAEVVELGGTLLLDIKDIPVDVSKVKKLVLDGSLREGATTLHFPEGLINLEELEIYDAVLKMTDFPMSVKKLKTKTNVALSSLPRTLPKVKELSVDGVGSVDNLGVWNSYRDPASKRIREQIKDGNDATLFPKAPKLEKLGISEDGWGGSYISDWSAIDYPRIQEANIHLYSTDDNFTDLNLHNIKKLTISAKIDDFQNFPPTPSLEEMIVWYAKSLKGLDKVAPNLGFLQAARRLENGVGIPESVSTLRLDTEDLTSLKGFPKKHFLYMADQVLRNESKIDKSKMASLHACRSGLQKKVNLGEIRLKADAKPFKKRSLTDYEVEDLNQVPSCEKAYFRHNIDDEWEAIATVRSTVDPLSAKKYALDYLRDNHLCSAFPYLEGLTNRDLKQKIRNMEKAYEEKCL